MSKFWKLALLGAFVFILFLAVTTTAMAQEAGVMVFPPQDREHLEILTVADGITVTVKPYGSTPAIAVVLSTCRSDLGDATMEQYLDPCKVLIAPQSLQQLNNNAQTGAIFEFNLGKPRKILWGNYPEMDNQGGVVTGWLGNEVVFRNVLDCNEEGCNVHIDYTKDAIGQPQTIMADKIKLESDESFGVQLGYSNPIVVTGDVQVDATCDAPAIAGHSSVEMDLFYSINNGAEQRAMVNGDFNIPVAWPQPIQGSYGPHDVSVTARLEFSGTTIDEAVISKQLTCGEPPNQFLTPIYFQIPGPPPEPCPLIFVGFLRDPRMWALELPADAPQVWREKPEDTTEVTWGLGRHTILSVNGHVLEANVFRATSEWQMVDALYKDGVKVELPEDQKTVIDMGEGVTFRALYENWRTGDDKWMKSVAGQMHIDKCIPATGLLPKFAEEHIQ